MNGNSWVRLLSAVTVVGVVLVGAGCVHQDKTPSANPTPTPTASQPATSAPPSVVLSPSATTSRYGPVWPLEPRVLPAASPGQVAMITAIRTGRHDTYDRLVFEFNRPFGQARVRYVPVVHADPSDQTVPLRGNASLEVTVQGAYARWGDQRPSYSGPSSVTPDYPTLKQVTMSGDFENVLSFGAGLDRIAGFTVARLRSPDRLVIDFAMKPAWRMWPDDSRAQAERVQDSFDAGHMPWRASVVAYFARMVYGWNDAAITHIPGTDEYWVSAAGSAERIRVRQVRPFKDTHRASIAEIADVR